MRRIRRRWFAATRCSAGRPQRLSGDTAPIQAPPQHHPPLAFHRFDATLTLLTRHRKSEIVSSRGLAASRQELRQVRSQFVNGFVALIDCEPRERFAMLDL